MDLSVFWFVVIVVGAFTAGLVPGLWRTVRLGKRLRTARFDAAGAQDQPVQRDAPNASAEVAPTTIGLLRSALDRTHGELEGATNHLSAARDELIEVRASIEDSRSRLQMQDLAGSTVLPMPDPTPTKHLGDPATIEFRGQFADLIGIESENASLRAVAERVPFLERRIAELEAMIASNQLA